ncbi:MAG: hypothetical protein ABSA75_13520 [Candidatus Bathyarchaeia archaeon]|jgi:hypothetical protein
MNIYDLEKAEQEIISMVHPDREKEREAKIIFNKLKQSMMGVTKQK